MKKLKIAAMIMACAGLMQSGLAADRLGVTIYKYDDNFMSIMRKSLESIAAEKKEFEMLMNDSQNQQGIQNDQVDALISKGVKALAINLVDPKAYEKIISQAKEEELPVVFFNRDPGQKALDSYEKVFFVGTNPKESGIIQGELIEKKWKANKDWDLNKDGKIQYVLLKGEPGHPDAEARTEYVVKTLKDKGLEVEQLKLDTAMWDTAQAKDKMQAWLSGPSGKKIEVVIANNDAMALGAIEAMKAQGKVLPTFGVDALPEALQQIKKGLLQGTVLNDAKGQSEAVYALASNLAKGKPALEGTEYKMEKRYLLVPYVGVDETNLGDYLEGEAKTEEKSEAKAEAKKEEKAEPKAEAKKEEKSS